MSLLLFVLRRSLSAIPVAIAVIAVTFGILHLIPGDPVETIMGTESDPAVKALLREQLGLNDPLPVQFLRYVGDVVQGDLGRSFVARRPVADIVEERLKATLLLALAGVGAGLAIGLPLGVAAALRAHRRRGRSPAFLVGTTLLVATPEFLLATALVFVFAVSFRLLPVAGLEGPQSIILPALALGIPLAGVQARVVRASVLDALQRDYVRTLIAAGVPEHRVIWRNVLRNAAIPIVTLLSVEFGRLLGGALIVENIFAWPGLGTVMFDSISRRDIPAVQGEILVVAMVILMVNLGVDILYRIIDPRAAHG
jgi:ABC-type dipeptide/oligopeptide/nickel transport system permease component